MEEARIKQETDVFLNSSSETLSRSNQSDFETDRRKFAGKGFRMKPVVEEGKIIGMRIDVRDVMHPLYQHGLRTNDILLSVNGTATNGPNALTDCYREIRNNATIEFRIERAGRVQTLVSEK